jgi:hypothetical protein
MRDATTSAATLSTRDATVKRRREFAAEMRAKGYKRVVRWVPDPENPTFAEQRKRDLQVLAEHQRAHPNDLIELTADDVQVWV